MPPQWVPTACPLDCPDACSLRIRVDHHRLVALDGDRRNRLTEGFICAKVRQLAAHVHGAERIPSPAVRTGPKGTAAFQPVSWDHALEIVAERLREIRERAGGESILPFSYGGSNGALTEGTVDTRLFRRLGASALERTVCAAASGAAHEGLYGQMPGVDLCDYEHASLIVLWGFNPSVSGIHLVPVLKRAQAAGARLVVIDPRATPLARRAELHLPVRPGTDVVLALTVVRWLFEHGRADTDFLREHCTGAEALRARASRWTLERAASVVGIDADDIRAFAQIYADAAVAVIRCGWGLERNRNGGSAVASVLALPAVAGKFGPRGGGFTMSQSHAHRWDLEPAIAAPAPSVRSINMNRLGLALLQAQLPIEALFVYNANPLVTIPDQSRVRSGLARDDLFTVVFDAVQTDTARYADVLLPATTFVEHHDLTRGYGAGVLNRIRPVIPPQGLARPNYAVFAELIDRLGLGEPGDLVDPNALADAITETLNLGPRADSALRDGGVVDPPLPAGLFRDRFPPTEDGKAHLCPPELDDAAQAAGAAKLYHYAADPASAAFPLALISPAVAKTTSSTFGQRIHASARVEVHPDDADARGIGTGDRVRVFNALGEVSCEARVSTLMRPGVLSLPKGLWCKHTHNGNTSTAVCPPTLTDLGRGATFNDARVQLERA